MSNIQFISSAEKYQRRLPKVGDILPAFDDGKIRPSRLYPVKVLEVLPWSGKTLDRVFEMINFLNEDTTSSNFPGHTKLPLIVAWNRAWRETDWIFSSETDYFIVTETGYEYEPIEIFARTKDEGWFSIELRSYMTGSTLDSDMKLFNNWKDSKWFSEDYEANKDKFLMQD